MTKSELIDKLALKQPYLLCQDVEKSVKSNIGQLAQALSKGLRIEIRGFGSFSLHYHAARNTRNPKTGADVRTVAKYTPHFKPGKELKERVNQSLLNGKPIKQLISSESHEMDE